MNTKKHLLIACFSLLINFFGSSQNSIDSLKLIPQNPTEQDSVKLIVYSFNLYTSCYMDTIYTEQLAGDIHVHLKVVSGIATALCNHVDTVNLGKLPQGTHQILAHYSSFLLGTLYDTDTLNFMVQGSNGLISPAPTIPGIELWPNPATSTVYVDLNNAAFGPWELEIFSLSGQLIRSKIPLQAGVQSIDCKDLINGSYFFRFSNEHGEHHSMLVLKTPS